MLFWQEVQRYKVGEAGAGGGAGPRSAGVRV